MEQDVRGSQGRREEGRAHRQPARLVTYPNSFPSPRSPVSISSPHTDAGTEARISVTAQGLWFVLMLDQGWGGGGRSLELPPSTSFCPFTPSSLPASQAPQGPLSRGQEQPWGWPQESLPPVVRGSTSHFLIRSL